MRQACHHGPVGSKRLERFDSSKHGMTDLGPGSAKYPTLSKGH